MCPRCNLDDHYRGQGDGIGSCDCPRCWCCGRGPDECECSRDFDDLYDDDSEPYDPLCNDTACEYRAHRLARKAAALAHQSVPHRYVAEVDYATCGLCHGERGHSAHLPVEQPEGSDRDA
jgi:hypothetical protein